MFLSVELFIVRMLHTHHPVLVLQSDSKREEMALVANVKKKKKILSYSYDYVPST